MSSLRHTHREALRRLLLDALHAPMLRDWVSGYLTIAGRRLDHKQKSIEILTLEDYLLDYGGQPGNELNMDLLAAFGDAVREICRDESLSLRVNYNGVAWLMEGWRFLLTEELRQDDALVIIAACSAVGTGIHAAVYNAVNEGARILMHIAVSPLRAMQQGIIYAFQRMLTEDWPHTMYELRRYVHMGDALHYRIALAAVAADGFVGVQPRALDAFDLHHSVLSAFRRLNPAQRKTADSLLLQLTLIETIGVLVAALPETGFPAVQTWLSWRDEDITALLRDSLNNPVLQSHEETARLTARYLVR